MTDWTNTTTPTWDRAKQAIATGDVAEANRLIDRGVEQWRSLQDYSINWVTSLLSFIGRELGEAAVERTLPRVRRRVRDATADRGRR